MTCSGATHLTSKQLSADFMPPYLPWAPFDCDYSTFTRSEMVLHATEAWTRMGADLLCFSLTSVIPSGLMGLVTRQCACSSRVALALRTATLATLGIFHKSWPLQGFHVIESLLRDLQLQHRWCCPLNPLGYFTGIHWGFPRPRFSKMEVHKSNLVDYSQHCEMNEIELNRKVKNVLHVLGWVSFCEPVLGCVRARMCACAHVRACVCACACARAPCKILFLMQRPFAFYFFIVNFCNYNVRFPFFKYLVASQIMRVRAQLSLEVSFVNSSSSFREPPSLCSQAKTSSAIHSSLEL